MPQESKSPSPIPLFDRTRRLRVSDALLVAAAPVVAYALAYAYETGYADRLGVPVSLVRIQPENIAWAFVILCAVLVPLRMLTNALIPLLPRRGNPRFTLVVSLIPFLVYVAIGFWLYRDTGVMWLSGVALWATLELAYFLPPALKRKAGTKYWDRFQTNLAEVQSRPSLFDTIAARVGSTRGLIAPAVLMISFWLSFGLGRFRASVQPERILIEGLPHPMAVIRSYGGIWLSGEVDTTTWTLTGRFMLLDMSAIAGHTLSVSYGRPIQRPVNHAGRTTGVPVAGRVAPGEIRDSVNLAPSPASPIRDSLDPR